MTDPKTLPFWCNKCNRLIVYNKTDKTGTMIFRCGGCGMIITVTPVEDDQAQNRENEK